MDNKPLSGFEPWSEIVSGLGRVGLNKYTIVLERSYWTTEITNGATQLGYWDWVRYKLEEYKVYQIYFVSRRANENQLVEASPRQ